MAEVPQVPVAEKPIQSSAEKPQDNTPSPLTPVTNESFLKATMKGIGEAGLTATVATVTEVKRPIRIFREEETLSIEANGNREQRKNIFEFGKVTTRLTRVMQEPLGIQARQHERTRRNNLQSIRSELHVLNQAKNSSKPSRSR